MKIDNGSLIKALLSGSSGERLGGRAIRELAKAFRGISEAAQVQFSSQPAPPVSPQPVPVPDSDLDPPVSIDPVEGEPVETAPEPTLPVDSEPPTGDPTIDDLAVRYRKLYEEGSGNDLNSEQEKEFEAEIRKFYGENGERQDRLKNLVRTLETEA